MTQGNEFHGAHASRCLKNEYWDSVSYLDSAFHHEYMRLRLKKGEFVYLKDSRLTRELDEFCDVDTMLTPRDPVILLGESGIGKSAFLANWIQRRRKMFSDCQSPYPEFIFSHVVGSSRQSCLVSNLLERILREIKEHFELNKEIPDAEERLSWQLPRFLEAASKKGRVILVVDGLHRLRTDNGDGILKWLPLTFPPNIRLIFTGTLNCSTTKLFRVVTPSGGAAHTIVRDDGGGSVESDIGSDCHKRSSLNSQMMERIKIEAGRRNWKLVHFSSLVEDDRKHILELFLSKTSDQVTHLSKTSGLQLVDAQQRAIISLPMSTSPQFLKIFLVCLLWAVKEGLNTHALCESWLEVRSIAQLLTLVLGSMESGYALDHLSTADAINYSVNSGNNDEKTSATANSVLVYAKQSVDYANEGRRVHLSTATNSLNAVAPLKELLGRALCLLYTSRHGLLLNELRFILNAVVAEAQGIRRSQGYYKDDEAVRFGRTTIPKQEKLTAFSEEQWQALLRALRTLSVLFVRGVVVIPMCDDILRDVVWFRYIGNEHVERQYHQWLIRFFRFHPTTFRRVEELPWHYKRCYQWDALRQVLIDLPMFQLLYTTSHKVELFDYWNLLTDGPLLNHSAATNMSDSPVYVMPFDIVKEYGKSIDNWYHSAHPTTKLFTSMVQLVTRFMYDFCLSSLRPMPQLVHSPLDLKQLYLDGFLFVKNLPHALTVSGLAEESALTSALTASSTFGSMPAMKCTPTALSALYAALDNFPPPVHTTSVGISRSSSVDGDASKSCQFYYYQRWIWIQFPWLALGCNISIRDADAQTNNISNRNNKIDLLKTPTLLPTTLSKSLLSFNVSHGSPGDEKYKKSRRYAGSSDIGSVKTMTQTSSQQLVQTSLFQTQSHGVKKSTFDPTTRRSRDATTEFQPASLKKSSVLLTSTSKSLPDQTLDVISSENPLKKKIAYATVGSLLMASVKCHSSAALKLSASSPTLIKQHEPAKKAISPSSKRDNLIGRCNQLKSESPAAHRSIAALSSMALLCETGGLHSKSRQSANTEELLSVTTAFSLSADFQDSRQSDWNSDQTHKHCGIIKLQAFYEAVKSEVAQKKKYLRSVKQEIREISQRCGVAMREYEMAQHAEEEMRSRLAKLEKFMNQIDHQEKRHRKLILACEMLSACAPAHFDANEKLLRLMQLKLKDLQNEKRVLLTKKTLLENDEYSNLREAVDKSKQLMSSVVDKLERASGQFAQDQASSLKLYQRRLDKSKESDKDLKRTMEEEARGHAKQAFSGRTRLLVSKIAHQQNDAICKTIQKGTGLLKMESILQKFMQREELKASLEEQANLYKAHLKQIEIRNAELKEQLHVLELSQTTALSEDPRILEQKLRAADVELARVDSAQTSLLANSKEVINGAARIVKLMGITNCINPHQNAIPASRLWPPFVINGGDKSSSTSGIETLEPLAIKEILQLCQDRATLMMDAVGGVLCDPDVNFSLVADWSSTSRRRTVREGNERTVPRLSRYHRPLQLSSVTEKNNDKNHDRNAILSPFAAPISAVVAAMVTQNSTPQIKVTKQNSDEEAEAISREAIKATSRKKVVQSKRGQNKR